MVGPGSEAAFRARCGEIRVVRDGLQHPGGLLHGHPSPRGWFFIGSSRGRRRRWCSMKTCGNQAKAARYRSSHP
ncbi:CGNR zinc finger domain-containing protein [Nocardia grenadensis]|uniref:CGNR zinc finger domain-containing protein n=1 Tax=Nocardia grenadensis TaxID=931537 RepID=UPI003D8FD16A